MNTKQSGAVNDLLERGRELLHAPRKVVQFTEDDTANRYLNDIENHPHLFVLGCVMDRQINYSRAWLIPYRLGLEIGGFEFKKFEEASESDFQRLFAKNKLHRFNNVAAHHFYAAIRRIETQYEGDAARIWASNLPSARVIRRLLEFEGVGLKIATMAANILVRELKVPMSHLSSIDISPDRRVTRYFKERGLLRADAEPMELIYLARELSPEFPGLLDYAAFVDGAIK